MLTGVNGMRAELVVIFGHWCPKCNMMLPVVGEIEAECSDILYVTRVEVEDEYADLPKQYGIELVPTFIIRKDQEELARMSGVIDKKTMIRRIISVIC